MRQLLRFVGIWVLRVLLIMLSLAALDVVALAFPYPLFPYRKELGEFTVRSNRPIPDGFDRVIEGARARVAAMEHIRPAARHRVFLCGDERLYRLFAMLTRRAPDTMAIGLAMLRNMYLNELQIARVAAGNTLGIRHSRFEGDLAEVIAHEIAHGAIIKGLGLREALALPAWKSEGYAEYLANLASTRADSSYAFADRVGLLLDDAAWRSSPLARQLFEWHVLVEFLVENQGMDLKAIAGEAVTEDTVRGELLAWHGQQLTARRDFGAG